MSDSLHPSTDPSIYLVRQNDVPSVQLEFVNALTKRLESLLPNITGYSLIEVELNQQFITTKNLLVDKSKLYMKIDGIDYVSYCFHSLCKILISINKESRGIKISDRDEKILSSTLIVLNILRELIQNYWQSKSNLSNFKSELNSMNFEVLTNFSFYYHFDPPESLNGDYVNSILETLMDILSNGVVKRVIGLIHRKSLDPNQSGSSSTSTNYNESPFYPSSPTSTNSNHQLHNSNLNSPLNRVHQPNHIDSSESLNTSLDTNDLEASDFIRRIDANIEVCLRFIATASPDEYYRYLYDNFFKYNYTNEQPNSFILQKYTPLIKFTFYNFHTAFEMAKNINKTLEHLRNTTWKQIILVFYSNSVRDQAFARPEDYDSLVESSSELETICKHMFDQTCSIFEEFPYSGVVSLIQTWISVLNPSDYREFELRPNKLKLSFNKRLKFINALVKDCHNRSSLTCFDSLITLFHLAGRFPAKMHNHPIYLFTMNHIDETFDSLTKLNLTNFGANLNQSNGDHLKISYDNLMVNFFVAAIKLKPEKYIDLLLKKFEETKENYRDVRIVIKVIKGLSENSSTLVAFLNVMKLISKPLKFLTFNVSRLLSQYYDTAMTTYSSSSSASIVSDRESLSSSTHNLHRKFSFDHELSPHSSRLTGTVHVQQQGHAHSHSHSHSHSTSTTPYLNVDDLKFSTTSASINSVTSVTPRVANNVEDLLADLFSIFKAAPNLFFNDLALMNGDVFYADETATRAEIMKFVLENVESLKVGLQSRSINNKDDTNLFNSTCKLILTIVDINSPIARNYNEVTIFANFITCKQIVKSICDSCVSLALTDVKFKSNLIFLNKFLEMRNQFHSLVVENSIVMDERSHLDESLVGYSMERILLLSLCTHDIQFYNIVKETMKWHLNQLEFIGEYFTDNLAETFQKLIQDESVFTGFVSLHKRFRNILRDAKPTKSLYQVWLIIYERWYDVLYNKTHSLKEENLLFRHFTGFLVSTSGCFLLNTFAIQDPDLRDRLYHSISFFFDKCTELLTSQDLVIRVIIKDALSNESHSAVYQMVSSKLVSVVTKYEENKTDDEESVLFTEQAIMIITAMIGISNNGAIVLTALLPEICLVFIKLINLIDDPINQLRLKLRFCKLAYCIESNRARLLISGAYKLRNFYAKATCDWFEQSVFYDEQISTQSSHSSSSNKSVTSGKPSSKDSELAYLNFDLATECSKVLAVQLEELLLDIPEGTAEKDVPKYKDLAFANYFSLFYKILTKYTSNGSVSLKSKHKIQVIVDNVLKCITNLLQYDIDIGLQLVFPLGYHDNKKIRSLFLSVFADMLYERKLIRKKGPSHTEELLLRIGQITDILKSASVIALNQSHNLYATSLFGIYGYLHKLDELFDILLNEEIVNVARTSDIFRRNSTLTKLLAKLAKDYGIDYLTLVLKDFVDEFNTKEISFNVEKDEDDSDPELFMVYLNKLVDSICNSADSMPKSFRYICAKIFDKVSAKVPDSGLVAVGSFIFLRFFCPAIISPEVFFDMGVISHTNKKSLLQLVKILQYMANRTLSGLKWKSLNGRMDDLVEINQKIFNFLQKVSVYETEEYPFESTSELPIPELRYLHKFFFSYYKDIKQNYLVGDYTAEELELRVKYMTICDQIMKDVGQPKTLLSIQGSDTNGYKSFDPSGTLSSEYNDFMNKMSAKYADMAIEALLIHNSIFHDGTPVVVVNLKCLRMVEFDINLLVYKLFETASQVWDKKFYFVFDFTEFSTEMHLLVTYSTLLNTYGPPNLFKNCSRIYYFNLPVKDLSAFFKIVKPSNVDDKETRARFYTYSHFDSPEIISSLCLSEETMSITRDKKVEFVNCKVLNSLTQTFYSATIRIGRQYLLFCSDEFIPTNHELCATKGFRPVEIFALSDVVKCEITKASGATDEFTIYFNSGQSMIVRSPERLEILRFLYFTTSRLPKAFADDEDRNFQGDVSNLWFGRLYNIVFQSLLCENDDVRSSASALFASVSNYFEIDYQISRSHAKDLAYPANTTDFIVAISKHLAQKCPEMTYRFFRAFFDCYEKLPKHHRMNAILYVSPWVPNICDYIYLQDEQTGPDRVAGIIRHFCLISALNKDTISAINDYIWKKLFSDSILIPLLLDEVVTFAMDNRNDDPDWTFIISVLSPSADLCGHTISRLIKCIGSATSHDSEIASESKLFEIMILVKICGSLFFDSYLSSQLYLADVFFICTLFIDDPLLEFGSDLQKLMINTIQSFFNKPDLSNDEQKTVEATLTYFSGQRAKMLFGLTRDKVSTSSDINQAYNRAISFEVLCDYLNEFINKLGSSDDKSIWRARWSSYAMDVAFTESSLFQVRAILVVGILSKPGISDQTAAQLFKLVSRNAFNNTLEYMSNVLISAGRICKGLSKDSMFPSTIIWPILYFGMLNYSALYQASIQCLLEVLLKNFEQGPGYIDRIFDQRNYLGLFINSFESSHGFYIDKNNFVCYVFFVFSQGLKFNNIKHTSLSCLKSIFKERYILEERGPAAELPKGLLPYLFFIWLSSSETSFREYLESTNYVPSGWVQLDGDLKLPSVIVDFLLCDDMYSDVTLHQAAYIFSTPTVDSGFKNKLLFVFNHIFNIRKQKGYLVYHLIKKELSNIMINSNSTDVVGVVSEIMGKIMENPDYNLKEHENNTNEYLDKLGISIMKDFKFEKLSNVLASGDKAKEKVERDNEKLQEMIYRGASSYVEHEKLEN